nr:hypothetical protein [Tanacetum cinerariifolium]
MFEPHVEDVIWRKQQGCKVLEWKLYDSCGVYSLRIQSMQVYMLVENIYALTPSTLTMMLEKKLQITTTDIRVKTITESYYCQYKEVTAAQVELRMRHLHLSYHQDFYHLALRAKMNAIASSLYHSLHPLGTPPLLPIPLSTPSTSRRAGIPEADTPPRNRPLLATPRPGCEVRESSTATARRPRPTMAHGVDCSYVETRL